MVTVVVVVGRCKLVYAPFGSTDQFSVDAVAKYEAALQDAEKSGVKIRALVITNPHNPLGTYTHKPHLPPSRTWFSGSRSFAKLRVPGRCYTRSALVALLRFCEKYGIHMISDEIYAHSVYRVGEARVGFTSVLSINLHGIIDDGLVHVMYGMSKVRPTDTSFPRLPPIPATRFLSED